MYEITKKIVFTGGGIEGNSALRFTLGRRRLVAYRIVQVTHSSQRRTKISRDDALVELHQWIDEADETHPIKAYELVGLHDLPRKISLDEGQRRVREYMVLGNCRTKRRSISEPAAQQQPEDATDVDDILRKAGTFAKRHNLTPEEVDELVNRRFREDEEEAQSLY